MRRANGAALSWYGRGVAGLGLGVTGLIFGVVIWSVICLVVAAWCFFTGWSRQREG
jgi:hypothetical protein